MIVFSLILSAWLFVGIEAPGILESLGGLVGVPEEASQAFGAAKTALSFISPANSSPECQDIIKQCANSKSVSCGERTLLCSIEAVLGPQGATYADTGELDLRDFMAIYAQLIQSQPGIVEKLLIQRCSNFLESRLISLVGGIFTQSSAPQANFVCGALTNRNVEQLHDATKLPLQCSALDDILDQCQRITPRAKLELAYPIYLSIVAGQGPPPNYIPGLTSVNPEAARALRMRGPIDPSFTPRGCWDSRDRIQCFSAALLAYVCESSCLEADCLWDRFLEVGGDCTSGGSSNFFRSASNQCQQLSAALMVIRPPPLCQPINNAVPKGSLLTVIMLMTSMFLN